MKQGGTQGMSSVEAEYDRYWREAGGMARLQRTVSLYESFRKSLEFRIRKKNPGLNDRQVAVQVARRMYLSDQATQALIDQMEAGSCKTISSGPASAASTRSSQS
jgi:hypothetical protein